MRYGIFLALAFLACACQPGNEVKAMNFGPTPDDEYEVGELHQACEHCGGSH